MLTDKTKKIECKNVFGDKRAYDFKLLDAESGTWLLHRFGAVVSTSYEIISPVVKRIFSGEKVEGDEESDVKLMEIIQLLPQVFDWETVKEVSREILPGTVVADEETSATIGDDGFSPLAAGDPLEQFTTIFYCICANFPKYISFLGVALDTPEDSTEGPADDSQTTH
jgi:hypothetical protein